MCLWFLYVKTIALKARKSSLEGLLQRHVEMVAEIKNLDTDLQMLVYENYNKFICATDTIKRYRFFYTLLWGWLWCYFSVYVTCNCHRYTILWKFVLSSHLHLAIYLCVIFFNVRFSLEKKNMSVVSLRTGWRVIFWGWKKIWNSFSRGYAFINLILRDWSNVELEEFLRVSFVFLVENLFNALLTYIRTHP